MAGQAVEKTATALRDKILTMRAAISAASLATAVCRTMSIICANRKIPLAELYAEGTKVGDRFDVMRKAYLSPRSVGFNVQGVRVAVHRVTGEIMILQSVHAADIGRLINPMQCRGQIDGAIAMGFGWALYEKMVYRRQRHDGEPGAARLPHSGLRRRAAQRDLFRRHLRHVGPLGAKAQGECAINAVAPAIANAVANATGVRFPDLPLTPDRIFDRLSLRS